MGDAIEARRAYRSFERTEITEETVRDLAYNVSLATSCWNRQPTRLIFVRDPSQMSRIFTVLAPRHEWARDASMIVAVFSRPEDDCIEKGRAYNQFDSGIATAFLLLRATELGLATHPVTGFDEQVLRPILAIPEGYQVMTLVFIGKHSEVVNPHLTARQAAEEAARPTRFPFEKFAYLDTYTGLR